MRVSMRMCARQCVHTTKERSNAAQGLSCGGLGTLEECWQSGHDIASERSTLHGSSEINGDGKAWKLKIKACALWGGARQGLCSGTQGQ